jgi:O-antigen/teichoic acid export membrane protein
VKTEAGHRSENDFGVDPPSGALAASTVRSRTLQSMAWRTSSQTALQLSRVAVAVVLARLLTPTEYGIAGMVLVFSSFVLPFADLGLGAALVQRPSITRTDLSTVFWLSVSGGLLFTLGGLALAGPVADFYGQQQVKPLFATLSIGFIVVSFATVQRSLLVREINFRSLELRNLAGTVVGSVLAILAAAGGYGPWALIIQFLAWEIVSTGLLWVGSSWRPDFSFSRTSARNLGGFGLKAIGVRLLSDVRQNGDKLVIGRILGSAPVGIYLLATNIVLTPFNRMVVPLQDVLFPAFSRIQEGAEAVGAAWLRVNRVLAAVSLPAMLGLVVVAPDFVPLVLGSRWTPAVPIIQLLAWVGLLQALQGLNGAALIALDLAGRLFLVTAAIVITSFAAIFAGLPWGLKGVAVAYAVANTITFPVYTWMVTRYVNISLWAVARSLAGVTVAACAMVVATFVVRRALLAAGIPLAPRFILEVLGAAIVYVGTSMLTSREVIREIRSVRARRGEAALTGHV